MNFFVIYFQKTCLTYIIVLSGINFIALASLLMGPGRGSKICVIGAPEQDLLH